MDALLVSALVVVGLAAGALAGWFAGLARGTTRTSDERLDLRTRLAGAEAARAGVQAQLDHQQMLYRELVAQTRHDQSARETREPAGERAGRETYDDEGRDEQCIHG